MYQQTLGALLSAVIVIATTTSSPPSVGFYAINLCPYGPYNISSTNSTNSTTSTGTVAFLAANANAATWAGTSASSCPRQLAPASQVVTVNSFTRAQHNIVSEMPRSKLYSLSLFRSTNIASAHLDFLIRDALGKVVVPRMQITLKPRPALVTELVMGSRRGLSEQQSTSSEASSHTGQRKKGKRASLQPAGAAHMTSEEQFERQPELPFAEQKLLRRGRRKGKGISGGIGGGGRYGGGSGGFRQAGATSAGKTYGYNSKALNSRYTTYSRTPYGYSGRSVYYGGFPMYMYMGGFGYHGRHYQSCSSYYGSSAARCRQQYSGCQPVNSSCEVLASTELQRDDIMEAAVDTSTASFPLSVVFYSATVAWQAGAVPEGWELPLTFGFSEVDLDAEDDAALSWFALILILIIPCCCCGFICWAGISTLCRRRRAAEATTRAREAREILDWPRQDSKELDIEAAVLPAYPVPPAVGVPVEDKSSHEGGRTCVYESPTVTSHADRVHAWKDEGAAVQEPAAQEAPLPGSPVIVEMIQPAPAKQQP